MKGANESNCFATYMCPLPPPFWKARYGNLQTFPKPTAYPTIERMKSILLDQFPLALFSSPPSSSSSWRKQLTFNGYLKTQIYDWCRKVFNYHRSIWSVPAHFTIFVIINVGLFILMILFRLGYNHDAFHHFNTKGAIWFDMSPGKERRGPAALQTTPQHPALQ